MVLAGYDYQDEAIPRVLTNYVYSLFSSLLFLLFYNRDDIALCIL